jgi:hypothetical protein
VFPKGFYYAGYAHEGAAWLTVALALATVTLSIVFSGSLLRDPRLGLLRKLAWVWSIENFLLAAAVYNRLFIYINFNGLSRMRMIGLFGISAVVIGFALVLWKIAHERGFLWLLRRHLWALFATIFLFALTPIDACVVGYNVRRILAGDPAPSVQISVHPISSEGVLLLKPLVHCDDPILREGIRAMLAERQRQAETLAKQQRRLGWTSYQAADEKALQGLRADRGAWADFYSQRKRREATLRQFHDYAYQWY